MYFQVGGHVVGFQLQHRVVSPLKLHPVAQLLIHRRQMPASHTRVGFMSAERSLLVSSSRGGVWTLPEQSLTPAPCREKRNMRRP